MGAWIYLAAAAAAKKRQEQARRRHHDHKKTSSGWHDDYSSSHATKYDHKVKQEDYIIHLSKHNHFVIDLFQKLEKYIKVEEERLQDTVCHQIDEEFDRYLEEEKEIADLVFEMEEAGIFLSPEHKSRDHAYPVPPYGSGFAGKCKYGYSYKAFTIGFNGIRITPNILLADEDAKTPYEEEYERWLVKNPDIENQITELKQTIDKKRKQLKWTPFNRKKLEEELEQLEKSLEALEASLRTGKQKGKDVQTFKNLTPKQKTLIMRYLKQIAKCEEIGSRISKLINEEIEIGRYGKRKDLFDIALQKALQAGEITEDDINKLHELCLGEELPKDDIPYSSSEYYRLGHLAEIYQEKYILPALEAKKQVENGDTPSQKKIN